MKEHTTSAEELRTRRNIWNTSYIRALETLDPIRASVLADEAINLYLAKWESAASQRQELLTKFESIFDAERALDRQLRGA